MSQRFAVSSSIMYMLVCVSVLFYHGGHCKYDPTFLIPVY